MSAIPVSTATTRGAAAVTPHGLATRAALDVMGAGGNAVDGAIAANAVLGMVLPTTCGIGGDLFAIVHEPGATAPAILNASGRGGSGLDATDLRARGHRRMPPRSPASVTVPGCVDGWFALAERFGSRPMDEVLAPAVAFGREGFPASVELSEALGRIREMVADQASAPPLYPGGEPPEPGETLRRPSLAGVLADVGTRGRDAFYTGRVGRAISTATGGVVSPDDLAGNRPDWVEPLGIDLFGRRAWTVPPNSQGYVTLAAAWILERLGWSTDPADPAFHHAVVEAYRAAAWDRDDLVADPDHLERPVEELLSEDRLEPRLRALSAEGTARWPVPPADPGGTAYFCTIDASGLAVSCIQSNFMGIGSGLSAADTGVWLHNRGAGFSLVTDHPNEAAPGKRPLHTLAPTLWTRDGSVDLLLGTRGGHQQPQYLLQAIARLFVAGQDPADAQRGPRWSMAFDDVGPGSVLAAEARMPEGVVAGLVARGHRVDPGPDLPPGWGPVSIISIGADGTRSAAADPRVSSAEAAGD